MVTQEQECLFGNVIEGEIVLNDLGKIIWDVWLSLPERYPRIELDEAIVMPNHVHGILWINPDVKVGAMGNNLP
jgi:REP element-mobilizing transposase RayT